MNSIATDLKAGKNIVGRKALLGFDLRYIGRTIDCSAWVVVKGISIDGSDVKIVVAPVNGVGEISVGVNELSDKLTKEEIKQREINDKAKAIERTLTHCSLTEGKGKVLRLFDSLSAKQKAFILKELYERGTITETDEDKLKKLRGGIIVNEVKKLVVNTATGRSLCAV